MYLNLKKRIKEYIVRIGIQQIRMANTIQAQRTVVKDIEDKEGRHCKICKKTLAQDLFYKRKNGKCELVCKKCRGFKREKQHRKYKQKFIYHLTNFIDIKCSRCGYNRNFSALDFHHKGKKTYAIAREMRNLTQSSFKQNGKVDRLTEEILNNCEILCANCHREHHTKYFMKLKKNV